MAGREAGDEAVERQVQAYNERDLEQFVACYADGDGNVMSRRREVREERITGRPDGDAHAVAIYRLDGDGLIDRVRLLR